MSGTNETPRLLHQHHICNRGFRRVPLDGEWEVVEAAPPEPPVRAGLDGTAVHRRGGPPAHPSARTMRPLVRLAMAFRNSAVMNRQLALRSIRAARVAGVRCAQAVSFAPVRLPKGIRPAPFSGPLVTLAKAVGAAAQGFGFLRVGHEEIAAEVFGFLGSVFTRGRARCVYKLPKWTGDGISQKGAPVEDSFSPESSVSFSGAK